MPSTASTTTKLSVFDQAAKIFDGWTDPDTGLRVLRLQIRGPAEDGEIWSTPYHQFRCFLDGGKKVMLHWRTKPKSRANETSFLLDLTTGKTEHPFPAGAGVREVIDSTKLASLTFKEGDDTRCVIWDMRAQKELASLCLSGWIYNNIMFLSDDRRAITFYHRGRPYGEKVLSRHDLMTPGEQPRTLLELDGWFGSHVMSCPTDPELYSYDCWPSPVQPIDQAIHMRTLDGKHDEPMKMQPQTLRPGDTWGARDHYVWTPDAQRVISYLAVDKLTQYQGRSDFNHFKFDWWLSASDWRTGEDFAARYPEGRWGGHMQVSPDSRQIICCGGPGFDKLFFVDLQRLREGWNEQVLCSYPKTVSAGLNSDPFPYPFALPDQSGVIFNAGWPGPEHGVYLCQWPK